MVVLGWVPGDLDIEIAYQGWVYRKGARGEWDLVEGVESLLTAELGVTPMLTSNSLYLCESHRRRLRILTV
jgi:hypothetical protein